MASSNNEASETELKKLISDCLNRFFIRKLEILFSSNLKKLLRNFNPYSFIVANDGNAPEIVEGLLRAHLNADDEIMFRDAFSGLITPSGSDFNVALVPLIINESSEERVKFSIAYSAAVNRFTAEFMQDFCFPDGNIDWEKLVRFVSEVRKKE